MKLHHWEVIHRGEHMHVHLNTVNNLGSIDDMRLYESDNNTVSDFEFDDDYHVTCFLFALYDGEMVAGDSNADLDLTVYDYDVQSATFNSEKGCYVFIGSEIHKALGIHKLIEGMK